MSALDSIIARANEQRASDVHIAAGVPVRFRIDGKLIDAVTGRKGNLSDKGAAAGFTADQPHRFQLAIDAGGGRQRNMFLPGQAAVRR